MSPIAKPVLLLLIAALYAVPALARPVEVSTCGQRVDGVGVLAGDLDCSATGYPAVDLRGRLDLNRHTITGAASTFAIHCLGNCKITGPGFIRGPGGAGVLGRHAFKMKNVNITGMALAVQVIDVFGKGRAQLEGCTLNENLIGISSTVSVRLKSTFITGNAMTGVEAAAASGADSGSPCVHRTVSLHSSTVSGNGGDPSCGVTRNCADVITCEKPPRLITGVYCDTTCQGGTGIPCTSWGLCGND